MCKNRGIYGFLGTTWVLITVAPRNSSGSKVRENVSERNFSLPPWTAGGIGARRTG